MTSDPIELYLARDFGEFKSKGIVWCRFEDPFATSHLLASKLKFGNTIASVQLWGSGETETPSQTPNRLLQSLALTRPVQIVQEEDHSESSSAEDSQDDEEDNLVTADQSIPAPSIFKVIVGSRAVEIDAREKCSLL